MGKGNCRYWKAVKLMNSIRSVDLVLWNNDDESLEINLEPWQVEAIVEILGLRINYKGNNTYDITMLSEKGVKTLLDSIPYKAVRKSEIK